MIRQARILGLLAGLTLLGGCGDDTTSDKRDSSINSGDQDGPILNPLPDGHVNNGGDGSAGGDCLDGDGDGYGVGSSCLGPDCDDSSPARIAHCDEEPPTNCTVPQEGCSCESGNAPCYEGPEGSSGMGACRGGVRTCRSGFWSPCEGQVIPQDEFCDTLDNDCDGETDEGVLSACGDCTEGCQAVVIDPTDPAGQPFPLPDDTNSAGVTQDDEGDITLGQDDPSFHYLWVANAGEGTVSKIDTETGMEVGRYMSNLDGASASIPVAGTQCYRDDEFDSEAGGIGNCPSRTAVDLNGDVWVANRAFNHQGSVTKIQNNIEYCVDRDGDGVIRTSRDLNGNGIIDMDASGVDQEFFGTSDDCILFTVPVGDTDAVPRALAICRGTRIGLTNVWVGLYRQQQMVALSSSGEILTTIDLPIRPYGAVCDSEGILWVTPAAWDNEGMVCPGIVNIDTDSYMVSDIFPVESTIPDCTGCYGIAVDEQNRVWLGGDPCEAIYRFDPPSGDWMTVPTPGRGHGRGVAARLGGVMLMAHSHGVDIGNVAHITAFDTNSGAELAYYDFSDEATRPVGVGVDFDGNIWAVNRFSNNVTRINYESGQYDSFRTGAEPYTYSDFTGYGLRNFTLPTGWYRLIIDGCPQGGTRWSRLVWDATVPLDTALVVRVRTAANVAGLDQASWLGPFVVSPADIMAMEGDVLEVEFSLRSEDLMVSPALHSVEAQFTCP